MQTRPIDPQPPSLQLSPEHASTLAAAHGTPIHVLDSDVATARAAALQSALPNVAVRYATKANADRSLLEALRATLPGVDVTSRGSLDAALAAGWAGATISVTGPGKDDLLLAQAAHVGATVSLGSLSEGRRLATIDPGAPCVLRINPLERIHAFRTTTTGASPFGIPEEEAAHALRALHAIGLQPRGVHVHRGSQCTSASAFERHAASVVRIALRLAAEGLAVRTVNLGGGLGVARGAMLPLDLGALGRRLGPLARKLLAAHPLELEIEPGRWIAGPAGALLLRVLDVRAVRGSTFVVVDGGLDAFLFATERFRDGAPYPMDNLSRSGSPTAVTVVGPACTPMDTIARDIPLPPTKVGDLLVIHQAGAYASGASISGFLGRPPVRIVAPSSATSAAPPRPLPSTGPPSTPG